MNNDAPTATHVIDDGPIATNLTVSAAALREIGEANENGLFPRRNGRKRCRGELWKMRTRGCLNANGERVVLRTVVEKRTVYTTEAWIDAYFTALAATPKAAQLPSDRERRRRSYANTRRTPQITPSAAATLRKHGLANAASIDTEVDDRPVQGGGNG